MILYSLELLNGSTLLNYTLYRSKRKAQDDLEQIRFGSPDREQESSTVVIQHDTQLRWRIVEKGTL